MDFNSCDACCLCIGNVGFNFFECPLELIRRFIDVVVLPFFVVVWAMGCDMEKDMRPQNFGLGLKIRRTTIEGCNRHFGAVHEVNAFHPWNEREHGLRKVLVFGEVHEAFSNGCGPFTLGVSEFDLFGGPVVFVGWV